MNRTALLYRCSQQVNDTWVDLTFNVLAWVVLNAVVTASLANVYDRLQSRVAWLVVLAACLALLQTAWGRRLLEKPDFRDA